MQTRTPFGCALAALASFLMLVPVTGFTAECGWLATSELNRLFPEQAPWRVTVGGQVGRCQFLSSPPPSVFAANQTVQDSPEAAAEFVKGLRPELEKTYELVPAPELGKLGFLYVAKPGAGPGQQRTIGYVGHRGKVAVIGTLSLQRPPTADQRKAGAQLVRAALSVADDEKALAAASHCPWFDAEVLDRILPGGNVSQQVYGENSCLASDDAKAVLTVSIRDLNPALLKLRAGNCTWEDVPDLGENAAMAHACKDGKPRASLQFVAGNKQVVYNLAPGAEPTAAQRQALLELGKRIQGKREAQ